MTVPNRSSLDELLAQAGWAKALARQLARDSDSADELVQRTWVAALEHPTAIESNAPTSLRRWMASVMRNFVRQDARERERRLRREKDSARPERAPDGAIDGIEGQRKLLEALHSLADPYRSTLYARFFEGLAPREIARRENTPVKTVKTRLARGLELLRERFDRTHGGDRAAWMAWIFPMAAKPGMTGGLLGALIVNAKLKTAAAIAVAICLLAIGVQLLHRDAELPETDHAIAAAASRTELRANSPIEASDAMANERISVSPPVVAATCPVPAHDEAWSGPVRGRVLDLDNRPVAGVHIAYEHKLRPAGFRAEPVTPAELRSDELGYFELPAAPRDVSVIVDDLRWVTVYKAYLGGDARREATIFVAPLLEFSGVVVDPDHRPLGGAEVELRLSASVKRNLERRLDSAYRQNFTATTDATGHFRLLRAPACEAELFGSAPGWQPATIPAPALDSSDIEIVLGAREKRPAIVRGIVLNGERKPIEGVNVGVGGLTKKTGSDGRFTFDLDAQGHGEIFARGIDEVWRAKFPRDRLRAVKHGLLPCEVGLPPVDELRLDDAPREFELILAGVALEIRGHVVDSIGKPVAFARLFVLDETPFGPIYSRVGESVVAMEASIEQLLRGGIEYAISDASSDGRFYVSGLTPRSYALAALDPRTMCYGVLRDVVAGSSGVRIELPGSASLVHVAGRVVSRSGDGLAGISLEIGRLEDGAVQADWVKSLRSDEYGRFDLGSINPEKLRIQVLGEEIFLIMGWQLPAGAKLDELEIVVSRRCPIKVELTPTAPRADEFSFLDAAGVATTNFQFEGPMISLPERCAIVDGVSEVFATEDSARTMLLYEAGKEVARLPVHLTPGEVTILRP